jgi:hypothetical protein
MRPLPFEILELAMHPEAPGNHVTDTIDPVYRAIIELVQPLEGAQANLDPSELARLLDRICVGNHAHRIRLAMQASSYFRLCIDKA